MIDDDFYIETRDIYCSDCDEVVPMDVTVFSEDEHSLQDVICPLCSKFIEIED